MNDYNLTDQELFELQVQVLHREMTEKRQADRIKAIILLDSGFSPSQVAEVLLIDRSTVRRDYKKGGVFLSGKSIEGNILEVFVIEYWSK